MPTISRTNIRVRRSDGREFPSIGFAYRQLLGTSTELGRSEHHRIRHALRRGSTGERDRHGFTWSAVGEVRLYSSVEAALAAATGSCQWSDLTFGVEIECISPMSHEELSYKLAAAGYNAWRVVSDGSVRGSGIGSEVVSPVLKGQAGLEALHAVMTLLKQIGCTVNSTCGLHVHIGVRDLEIKVLRNLSLQFLAAEQHFDSIVPSSRRGSMNHYCRSNTANRPNTSGILEARSASGLAREMNGGWSTAHYNSYRYHKLNFQSFALHGTVEFRQHAGTVEAEKACSWVRLITGFVAAAANADAMSAVPVMSFEQFVGFTDEAGQRFFARRREVLGTALRRAA